LTPLTPIGTIALLSYFRIASCDGTWSKPMEFHKRLDLACRARDLGRNAVLDALNQTGNPRLAVSKATVGRWFNGQTEPSISQGVFLARLLGMSVEALFGEEHEIEGARISGATMLTDQEQTLVALARHMGVSAALDRLAHISRVSSSLPQSTAHEEQKP
jgi:DNA-binding XRE family transcriptional regulator